MTDFLSLGVPRKIAVALAKQGVHAPFPIQSLTIADALAGRDLSARAPTGSGKTLAFAVPLATLTEEAQPRRPRALVLVPTRELAAQVAGVLRPLAQARNLVVTAFYGGTSIGKDVDRLSRGVDIAVACPGRLADLVQRRAANLSDVRFVVIDEADRMADMGFLPEVKRLLDQTAEDRQTLLFSATLDGDVDVLVRRYQRDPVRRELAASSEEQGEVRHLFWSADAQARVGLTAEVVRHVAAPAIVFTRTKHGADRVAKQLARVGVPAAAIHGNRTQGQRQRALDAFTSGRVATLVATDVAARGIHVDDVGVVVHFDPPATDKDYVHRSGRTGRAGADGLVVTLVPDDRRKDVKAMQRALGMPTRLESKDLARLGPAGTPGPVAVAYDDAPAPRQNADRHSSRGRRGESTAGGRSSERGGRDQRAGQRRGRGRDEAGQPVTQRRDAVRADHRERRGHARRSAA